MKALVELGAFPERAENGDCGLTFGKCFYVTASGKSPFILAAERGVSPILQFLLDKFSGEPATMSRNSAPSMRSKMISCSVDIDLPDLEGNTCLHAAVRRCQAQESARAMVVMLVNRYSIVQAIIGQNKLSTKHWT